MGIVLWLRTGGRMALAGGLGALAATGLLFGCLPEDPCELPTLEQTPKGYWVFVPSGPSLAAGVFTKEEVFAWLEDRIDQWVARRETDYGGRERLYAVAHSYPFILYDDYRFPCESSPTGFCAGQHWIRDDHCKHIEAAIWSRAQSGSAPPGDGAPIVRSENGTYSYGYLPGGTGLWVIGHELDHGIGAISPTE